MEKIIVTTKEELQNIIQASVNKALAEYVPVKAEDKSEFLPIKEACKLLNLARQTIYGLTSKRLIPFIKRGKKLYFKRTDLINWLNEGKKKSVGEIKGEL